MTLVEVRRACKDVVAGRRRRYFWKKIYCKYLSSKHGVFEKDKIVLPEKYRRGVLPIYLRLIEEDNIEGLRSFYWPTRILSIFVEVV